MHTHSRRLFLASSAALAFVPGRPAVADETASIAEDSLSVEEALAHRRSTRLYAPQPLAADLRLRLLHAADGVNRPDIDGRTAPSWYGAKDTDIYVAEADGVGKYDPVANSVHHVLDTDIRKQTSPEPFVGAAPMVLIYVSDRARLSKAGIDFEKGQTPAAIAEEYMRAAYVNTAVIAQNVYLFCASQELGTCLVGGVDPTAIGKALGLAATQRVTYVQPVGHLKA
jgi:nitroreductase